MLFPRTALLLTALAARASAAPSGCVLDGTLWHDSVHNVTMSVKSGLGPSTTVFPSPTPADPDSFFFKVPRTTEACDTAQGCLRPSVAGQHGCTHDPSTAGCRWLKGAADAAQHCATWAACGGFTCNTKSNACFSRGDDELCRGGAPHEQTKGSYDATTGSVLRRVATMDHTLYLKGDRARYTVEGDGNCGATDCSWRSAAGHVVHSAGATVTVAMNRSDGTVFKATLSPDCAELVEWPQSADRKEAAASLEGQGGAHYAAAPVVWRNLNLDVKKLHVIYMVR